MTDDNQPQAPAAAGSDEAKPEAAQATVATAEASANATAGDELSEEDLEAVAGGKTGGIGGTGIQ
jgi:hypothetical protein